MPLTRQESAHGASSLRSPAAICLTALLLLIGAAMLPPIPLFEGRHGAMLAFHLLLETFSVVVSALVVIMAWHRFDRSGDHASNVLIFGFSVVAGTDLIHALTYAGMPALLTESSTAKAIFFWLAGRSFELLTVALVAARIALPAWVNTAAEIVKASTLLSIIGVAELLLATQEVIARSFMGLPFYFLAGVIYFAVNFGIEQLGKALERRLAAAGR